MDGPRDKHAKWSKPDKDIYRIILLIYEMWKKILMTLFKTETDLDRKQTYGYQRENAGRDKLGGWD